MQRLPTEAVQRWGKAQKLMYPIAFGSICPHCGVKHGFSNSSGLNDSVLRQGRPLLSACPGCQGPLWMYLLNPAEQVGDDWEGEIWIHPSPRTGHAVPLDGVLPVTDGLRREYQSALDCFALGQWRAAAQASRVVLEAVVAKFLPEADPRQPLASRLKELATTMDLDKPILDAAAALKDGGNLASHFSGGHDFDVQTAEEMLELLGFLLTYLLVVPAQIEQLKTRIES